ncbi:MAG: peptidoglycan bridge formation glycyltransferase FemA/FemB family protein [Bacilli bacterium]|nr:peptidoglycan bridge formation glycyltransferase FemA/FemB family protein [Bacilli bacterium]
MKFQEITEKEYHDFWENHPLKTFLSSIEISKLRKKSNWDTYYVGVKENKTLVAATMLLSHKRHLNKYEFYSPRGYLMDFKNIELLDFFTKELKKYIKSKNGYILRIDPYVIYKERDIDGNIVEGGEDNSFVVEELKKLGFNRVKEENMEQVGWMFSLNLEGKTEEDILKEMKPNTRNTIRKAEKFGIQVNEISYEELERFQSIMEETSKRKGFSNRKLSYYQDMYQLFSPKKEVKFFITELNVKNYLNGLKKEKEEKEEKINHLSDAKYNDGAKKNLENEINSLEKRIKESEEIIEKEGKDTITLSGSMFMLIQPEIIYLSSGNYEEYMKFNSQYLIQWELIKYGIENGFKKHNFYGIPANINTHPKDYGIYEFKRGFNGYVEELIGEYELPITWHYKIFQLIHKIRGGK